MTYINKLTDWQKQIGYKQEADNMVSMVALLGVAGESGEVLDEVLGNDCGDDYGNEPVRTFIDAAYDLDDTKKVIRNIAPTSLGKVNPSLFDVELSDLFYYINILAMNRGLTLEDLARISYEKVTQLNKERVIK